MSITATIRVALAVLAALTACAPAQATDRVIAESETSVIMYKKVRCHPRLRDAAEKCQQAEQATLRMWIYERAIECAVRLRGIDLTPDELRSADARVVAERPAMERIAGRHRALLRGVLRIQEGEQLDRVTLDLAKMGIRAREVEERLAYYESAEQTRKALQTDPLVLMEAAARAGIRRDLLFKKLADHVGERSRTTGRSIEEEENALWEAVIQRCRIRVVDNRYDMPDFKGVFKTNVEQIPIH